MNSDDVKGAVPPNYVRILLKIDLCGYVRLIDPAHQGINIPIKSRQMIHPDFKDIREAGREMS